MVNSTHYQAMCRAFSSSFGLCFFQYLKISKPKDKRSMQRFSEDTKTHNIINIRTYIYEAKIKRWTKDEPNYASCRLLYSLCFLFFLIPSISFLRQTTTKIDVIDDDDRFCVRKASGSLFEFSHVPTPVPNDSSEINFRS